MVQKVYDICFFFIKAVLRSHIREGVNSQPFMAFAYGLKTRVLTCVHPPNLTNAQTPLALSHRNEQVGSMFLHLKFKRKSRYSEFKQQHWLSVFCNP